MNWILQRCRLLLGLELLESNDGDDILQGKRKKKKKKKGKDKSMKFLTREEKALA